MKEAEQQDHARTIKEECQKAILRVAELSSDDFHLDRHLYFSCRDDRERFCSNVRPRETDPAPTAGTLVSTLVPLCRFKREKGKFTSVCSTTSLRRPCLRRYQEMTSQELKEL